MKKITIALPALALLLMGMTACGGNKKDGEGADSIKNVRKEAKAHEASTNICFVNLDTVYQQYTLAKEMLAENTKMSTELESWANKQQQALNSSMQTLQNKVEAGQMTEQAAQNEYQSIMQRRQSFETEGQRRSVATQNLILSNEKRVQDSIHNFLVDFNATNKFDAIIPSAAALLYNPALDVTDEIVKGLNVRYKTSAPAATTDNNANNSTKK